MLKKLTKGLSLLLVFCLMVSLLSVGALAVGEDEAPAETPVVEEEDSVLDEVPEEETDLIDDTSEDASDIIPSEPVSDEPAAEEPADEPVGDEEELDAGIMPQSDGVDAAAARSTSSDPFYKIVHVDCGRKYFSPENIKKLIDNAAAAGFNQVELYLSDNQGFRFALDDMKVTTSTGNTYDLTPALGDGYSDGSKYPDGSGKYLTQSEMPASMSPAIWARFWKSSPASAIPAAARPPKVPSIWRMKKPWPLHWRLLRSM